MKHLPLIMPGCLLAGLSAYSILSYLLVPIAITLPLSLVISILIFGLTKYYLPYENRKVETRKSLNASGESTMANITFVTIFVVVLLIILFFPSSKGVELFVDWKHISPVQVIKITAAASLCFFLPGYSLVMILDKEHKLTMLLRLLLAYTSSMLFAGVAGYIGASFGYEMFERRVLIISPSIFLLLLFVVQRFITSRIDISKLSPAFYYNGLCRIWKMTREKNSQLIIFASLFALVILYTYYLNNGEIVVDQWFYHGRALLMSSPTYKELSTAETYTDPYETKVSDINEINPPFFSALLSAFFNLSGSPSVNAYTSINILNIMPVLAFYYFFTSWVSKDNRRAVMIAVTLFMLSSGFGWVYVLYSTTTSGHMISTLSTIDVLSRSTDRTYDIALPTTFINVGHPDVTTPFLITALPAGLTLLGLVGQLKHIQNKSSNPIASNNLVINTRKRLAAKLMILIVIITVSGILAHDEFYLFIIISSTLILFGKTINTNYSVFFTSFLAAILLITLVDFLISPINYYTQREISGIPLIALAFLYVSASWGLYLIRISNIHLINSIFNRIKTLVPKLVSSVVVIRLKTFHDNRRTKFVLRIVTASIVAYLYLFTLFVWAQVSDEDIRSHVKDEWNVPWYLYPVKFGLAGLLGLAFLVSYIFKKFEKEIFVFGIVALIAFLAGPYYDEHRFGKYMMISMDAFASLLIYQIISSSITNLKLKIRPLTTGLLLGSVIIASSLSVLMFAGYVELFTGVSSYIEGGRRDFPTPSEFQLLNFLRDKVYNSKTYNIAVPEKEVGYSTGFITKIYGFSALPRLKLLQSPLTLNASTIEAFYNLLDQSDTRYIVFPRTDFTDTHRQGSQVLSSSNNIIQFALDNFPRVYQDKNYVVLEVPSVLPPSPGASNVGFIYQRDDGGFLSPPSIMTMNLPVNDNNISAISKDSIKSSRNSTTVIVSDDNIVNNYKGTILWTHPVQLHNSGNTTSEKNESKINYFEASFRIMDSNSIDKQTGKKIKYDDYDAGILWLDRSKEYNLLITKDGLELSQTPITEEPSSKIYKQGPDNNSYSKGKNTLKTLPILLSQNQEIKREKGIWYNMKLLLLNNTIYVYVNDVLKIKTPIMSHSSSLSANENATDHVTAISKVGIRVFHDRTEFHPILLGHISELGDHSYLKQNVYNRHFYPLTMLALSNLKYETFLENDLSAFSKKYVILPFDPLSDQVNDVSRYLDYARNGGSLIVIDSDKDNVQGIFAKLLSIRLGNTTNFVGITSATSHNSSKIIENRYSIPVSGVAKDIILPHSDNDMTVKSYYVSNNNDSKNRMVAPFAIEKNYGLGKVIFVNAIGYFDTILTNAISPKNDIGKEKNQFFMSLANVSNLIDLSGLQSNDYVKINSLPITSLPPTRIIGDLEIASGETGKINGSSILLPDSSSLNKHHSYDLSLKEIAIPTLNKISVLNHKESNTITDLTSTNKGDLNFSRIKYDINNARNFKYGLQNVLIKNLMLYGGPFEVTIYSTNSSLPIRLPTSSSYNDYIGVSIPTGFDIALKLPNINSSYVEFDEKRTADKNQPYQTVRIYGSDHNSVNTSTNGPYSSNNEVYFRKVKPDIQGIKSISVLLKHPEITVFKDERSHSKNEQVDVGKIAVSFKEDSHKSGPIEIKNTDGNILAKISYVDNYNRRYHTGIKTQFLTYLEQPVEVISDNGSTSSVTKIHDTEKRIKIEMPGDISEYAKKHGMQIPWIRALSSDFNISLATSVFAVMIIALWRILPRIREV